jgi:glycosyltransferase involved in cell wall biosynthesis
MKIALSTRSFRPPLIGGVDVYTDRLGRALERKGNEIFFLAFNSSAEYPIGFQWSEDHCEGRRIWRCLFDFGKRSPEYFQLGYDPEMGAQIRSILELEQPDLLIILNFYMSTLAGVTAATALDLPVIHIATDYLPICRRATMIRWNGESCRVGESIQSCSECFVAHKTAGRLGASLLKKIPKDTLISLAQKRGSGGSFSPLRALNPYWKQVELMQRRLERLGPLRRQIDLVLAPTQYTAQVFKENGFLENQIQFLPFGVDPEDPLANVVHTPADHIRFLFIGRLQPYKGAHVLVEAFNNLASPKNATLAIYGVWDGYDKYYQELNSKINANPFIQFKGKIPPAELGSAFAEADYFVLPSTWHENSPLILLDALQSKTPVISSEISGVTDMVKHNVNGLLFSMGDANALRDVMQRVIDHPEMVEQFRDTSNLLSIDAYAEAMLIACHKRGLIKETLAI